MGKITAIYISPAAAAPVQSLAEAHLEAGRGIVGDRYYAECGTFSKKLGDSPDREVTLIELEQVDEFNRTTGMKLEPGALRRNIVTKGVDLNALVGVRFTVGDVTLEGIRLCEPCEHIARLVAPELLTGMVHKAGLRAGIIRGGIIRPGDSLQVP